MPLLDLLLQQLGEGALADPLLHELLVVQGDVGDDDAGVAPQALLQALAAPGAPGPADRRVPRGSASPARARRCSAWCLAGGGRRRRGRGRRPRRCRRPAPRGRRRQQPRHLVREPVADVVLLDVVVGAVEAGRGALVAGLLEDRGDEDQPGAVQVRCPRARGRTTRRPARRAGRRRAARRAGRQDPIAAQASSPERACRSENPAAASTSPIRDWNSAPSVDDQHARPARPAAGSAAARRRAAAGRSLRGAARRRGAATAAGAPPAPPPARRPPRTCCSAGASPAPGARRRCGSSAGRPGSG